MGIVILGTILALFAVQNPQVNLAPMETLECGRHVIVVREQTAVRLGQLLCSDFLDGRQRQAGLGVQGVERINVRQRCWRRGNR